jgi:hypothetical protein
MTEEPQPTNVEILAAVRAPAAGLAEVKADVAGVKTEVTGIKADVAQVRADIVAVNSDAPCTERYIGDPRAAVRRHADDPEARHRAA